jgi:hypothetical protein
LGIIGSVEKESFALAACALLGQIFDRLATIAAMQ